MADEFGEDKQNNTSSSISSLLRRLISKRRTWVFLVVLFYALIALLTSSSGWTTFYAFVLFGAVFGLLIFLVAVAVLATVVTWITALVLLTHFGKPRRVLVLEAKKKRADIAGFAINIVLKEWGRLID